MNTETKRCPRCGEEKSITEYYQYKSPKNYQKVDSYCKQCRMKQSAEARLRKRAKRRSEREAAKALIPEGYKQCYTCKQVLPLSSFSLSKNNNDGHRGSCRDCTNKYAKSRRKIKTGIFRADDGRLYQYTGLGRASFYWTPDMLSVLKRYYSNTPTIEVAEMLDMNEDTVRIKAHKMGLEKSKSYMLAQHREAQFYATCKRNSNKKKLKQSQPPSVK